MQIAFNQSGRARTVAQAAKDYINGVIFQYPNPKVQVVLSGALGAILGALRPYVKNDQATVTLTASGDQTGLTIDLHIVTAQMP